MGPTKITVDKVARSGHFSRERAEVLWGGKAALTIAEILKLQIAAAEKRVLLTAIFSGEVLADAQGAGR